MPNRTYSYKNVTIEYDTQSSKLLINGKEVHLTFNDNKYWTDELPYQHFDDLEEIAESLIDNSPNHKNQ